MNLAQLRDRFLREIQDAPIVGEFTAAQCNELLNNALARLQLEIVQVAPNAFHAYHHADIVSGEPHYDIPDTAWRIDRVFLLNSAGLYVPVDAKKNTVLDDIEGGLISVDSTYSCYSIDGRFVRLYPTPTANLTNGLRLRTVPILTMALDSSIPQIHTALHPAIPLLAKMLALEESGEPANQTLERVKFLYIDIIPGLYSSLDNTLETLVPQVDKSGFGM